MVTLDGAAETEKSSPVPLSETLWGLPSPLSMMVSAPVIAPAVVGWKMMLMLQFDPGFNEARQLFVWAKPLLTLIDEIANGPGLLAFSCTVLLPLVVPTTWVPKERLVGESVGSAIAPLPATLTPCGLPDALSVMLSVPLTAPLACGANVTEMVQFAPDARVVGQLLVWAKG